MERRVSCPRRKLGVSLRGGRTLEDLEVLQIRILRIDVELNP